MKAAVLMALLALTAGAAALKCYTCSSVSAGIDGQNLNTLAGIPSCDDFDPSSPDKKFEKYCTALENDVCISYVDSGDSKAQLRGCSVGVASLMGCEGNTCYCAEDLCNGSGPRGWAARRGVRRAAWQGVRRAAGLGDWASAAPAGGPSAALLLLAAVAATLGAR